MRKCITVWNYAGDELANARKFHALGFDAVSWLGSHFVNMTEDEDEQLAALLRETQMQFTVHSRLPDPDQPEACQAFSKEMERAAAWQQKYGLMHSYTFDFWFEVDKLLPYLSEALSTFRDTDTMIACEDIPLNKRQLERFERILKPRDRFGILLDAGHMNIRQRCMELIEPEDFITSIQALPLPIIELHLHDNKSYKDEHKHLGYGNLPLDAIIIGLKRKRFDGYVTIEIVPREQTEEQAFQYATEGRDLFLQRWEALQA